jgi:UDP-N-acetylmuramate-alanine ligase
MKVNIVEVEKPNNDLTMDALVMHPNVGIVTNIDVRHPRYFWNSYHRSFVNCRGALNPPFESLRKALTDNEAIKEVQVFNTAKELYQWLAEEN